MQSLRNCIRGAVACGLDWIQLREKDLATGELFDLVKFAIREARKSETRILVNDRLDIAIAAAAEGVHLGENSIPASDVVEWRRSAGHESFQIGASCHSLDAALAAERAGADYVIFGPIFATPSKAAYGEPQGLDTLRAVCAAVVIPVLAIGGITLENADECTTAGATGIAAIRLFQESPDLQAVVNRLRSQ
jgi:thiamine-phosphate pyrophosphorylase